MKTYVWLNVKALQRWGSGDVVVVAGSLNRAIELAAIAYETKLLDVYVHLDNYDLDKVARLRDELGATNPAIVTHEQAFVFEGSQ